MNKNCRYFFYLKIELKAFDEISDYFWVNPRTHIKVLENSKRNIAIFTSYAFASSPQEALLQIFFHKTKIYTTSVFTNKRAAQYNLNKTYTIIHKLIEKLERDCLPLPNNTQRIFKPTLYLINLSKKEKTILNTQQCFNILCQIRRDFIKNQHY